MVNRGSVDSTAAGVGVSRMVNLGSSSLVEGVGVSTIVNRGSALEVEVERIVAVPIGSAPSPGI
jgi:hypothetical protein